MDMSTVIIADRLSKLSDMCDKKRKSALSNSANSISINADELSDLCEGMQLAAKVLVLKDELIRLQARNN